MQQNERIELIKAAALLTVAMTRPHVDLQGQTVLQVFDKKL